MIAAATSRKVQKTQPRVPPIPIHDEPGILEAIERELALKAEVERIKKLIRDAGDGAAGAATNTERDRRARAADAYRAGDREGAVRIMIEARSPREDLASMQAELELAENAYQEAVQATRDTRRAISIERSREYEALHIETLQEMANLVDRLMTLEGIDAAIVDAFRDNDVHGRTSSVLRSCPLPEISRRNVYSAGMVFLRRVAEEYGIKPEY